MVVVVLAVDERNGDIVTGPEIITRGCTLLAEELIEDACTKSRRLFRVRLEADPTTSRDSAVRFAVRSASWSTSGRSVVR